MLSATVDRSTSARRACGRGASAAASMGSTSSAPTSAHPARGRRRAVRASAALYAGGAPLGWGRREAAIARFDGQRWQVTARRRLGRDAAFMAMDGDESGRLWAVGFVRTPSIASPARRPQATRRRLAGRRHPPPARRAPRSPTSRSDGTAGTWAVGYAIGQPGRHAPWALRWDGRRFVDAQPEAREGERGRLTAVSVERGAARGSRARSPRAGSFARTSPVGPRGAWQRQALPDVGEAVSPTSTCERRERRVGRRISPDRDRASSRSCCAGTGSAGSGRHERHRGRRRAADGAPGRPTAVARRSSVPPGTAHRPRFEGLTARSGSGGWSTNALTTLPGQTGLTAVDGIDASAAWLAGSTVDVGAAVADVRSVGAARAGRRADARAPAARRASGGERRAIRERRRRASRDALARPSASGEALALVRWVRQAAPPARRCGRPRRCAIAPSPQGCRARRSHGARSSPTSTTTAPTTSSSGATARGPALPRPRRAFVDAGVGFGSVDRHGCAADDVDGSGLPDLYCSVGGRRGTGVKANQLWLDPAGPARTLDPLVGRAAEPLGRGRVAAFLDVDLDGHDDLFVGQETERMDGLPSDSRVYLRRGPGPLPRAGGIRHRPRPRGLGGLDRRHRCRRSGPTCCSSTRTRTRCGATGGVRLYRNVGGRFRDVTSRARIRSIGESDAELADLDGDGRADLIQLSASRIRISLSAATASGRSSSGVSTAASRSRSGDADGDGDADIFVLRQKDRRARRRRPPARAAAGPRLAGGPRPEPPRRPRRRRLSPSTTMATG